MKNSLTAAEPTLEGIDLVRSFGQGDTHIVVLRGVSLKLYAGQVTTIMGPSGSGKSTLIALLSGLLKPDSGKVLPLGTDLWALPDHRRRQFRLEHFGFIFQGFHLFPALTARQQLEIVLRWGEGSGGREARRRATEMLELFGIREKAHLLPDELSGGEKQRVAVARALIKRPSFCFADEPTSSLDWERGKQVIELLRAAAHERGATIMIVSHDHRLLPYCDQVIEIEDGRLTT